MAPARNDLATAIELPSDLEIVMTRVFDAPPRLVYAAWTNPELVPRWWCCGDDGYSMPTCTVDLRVGGAYRFVMRSPDGQMFPLAGEYRELVPPARIVKTQRFDVPPYDKDEMMITMTFEPRGERTLFTSRTLYSSKAVRDAQLARLQQGALGAIDRLADLVGILAHARSAS